MIEFEEFISIIKGGSAAAKDTKVKDNGTGAIYNFFKQLTSKKFIKKNENMPFKLFISHFRRQKILDSMMGATPEAKAMGDKILENYKKQLSESIVRNKVTETDGESDEFNQKRM